MRCNKLSEKSKTKIYVIASSLLSLMRILASMSPYGDRLLPYVLCFSSSLKYLDAQFLNFYTDAKTPTK